MQMELRDYQQLAIQHISRRIEDGCSRLYVTLPTGTGKSMILTAIAAQEQEVSRVLVLVHLQEIALQLVQTLRQVGLEVGLLMQGRRELTAPTVVATVQSLTPANTEALFESSRTPIARVLIDEAHHAVEGSAYERIIASIEAVDEELQVVTIGFTATPYRNDKRSMLALLPTCAFARDIPDMVRAGWLAPLTWKPLRVNVHLARVATTGQSGEIDYVEEELARELLHNAITEDIVQQVVSMIGQRPTLAFAVTVEHATQLAEAFRHLGLKAAAVSGQTSRREREHIFSDWRNSMIQIVCNCTLLTEGFDFPSISALIIVRPTLSPLLYVQMLGRGTRLAEGKQDCLVIDVMGNQPDTSSQVVLPHVIGVSKAETGNGEEAERSRTTDPILKALLGADTETGLSLLDPIGQSHYRWVAYRHGYFARITKDIAAIIERDPEGSGLYRSRLYTKKYEQDGQKSEHHWITKEYLPLRQQVALVHDHTKAIARESFSNKDAPWLAHPATPKQIAQLRWLHPKLARQAIAKGWNKRTASDVITYYSLKDTLIHPPEV
jgi:superfamily II DNA or RNA helicase